VFAANSRQQVDLWIIPQEGGEPEPPSYIGIELKVESAFQTGTQGGLVARYRADIAKCLAGPRQELRQNRGVELYAIGITSLATDLVGYEGIAQQSAGNDFFWIQLADGLYMISWKGEWPQYQQAAQQGGHQAPQYGGQQAPQYGGHQAPQYGGHQAPQYGGQQAPQYGGQQASQYGGHQGPQYGGQQAG